MVHAIDCDLDDDCTCGYPRPMTPNEEFEIALSALSTDELLDLVSRTLTSLAAAERRSSTMARTHDKGERACEVCGRPIRRDSKVPVGPECFKKLVKLLDK